MLLEPALAQTVAVVFHELATNAAKYGALSGPKEECGLIGPSRTTAACMFAGWNQAARTLHHRHERGSACA